MTKTERFVNILLILKRSEQIITQVTAYGIEKHKERCDDTYHLLRFKYNFNISTGIHIKVRFWTG
jgi:hypothetical protein